MSKKPVTAPKMATDQSIYQTTKGRTMNVALNPLSVTNLTVIIHSKFKKCYSKAKRRALAY